MLYSSAAGRVSPIPGYQRWKVIDNTLAQHMVDTYWLSTMADEVDHPNEISEKLEPLKSDKSVNCGIHPVVSSARGKNWLKTEHNSQDFCCKSEFSCNSSDLGAHFCQD